MGYIRPGKLGFFSAQLDLKLRNTPVYKITMSQQELARLQQNLCSLEGPEFLHRLTETRRMAAWQRSTLDSGASTSTAPLPTATHRPPAQTPSSCQLLDSDLEAECLAIDAWLASQSVQDSEGEYEEASGDGASDEEEQEETEEMDEEDRAEQDEVVFSEVENDEDEDDEEEEEVAPRPRRRRPRVFQEPNSDNDPDPPGEEDSDEDTPDATGWSRSYSQVLRRPFKGDGPGPTFRTGGLEPVDFFHKFFPLSLFVRMVAWTNSNLTAGATGSTPVLTNLQELKAWFGIVMVMGLDPVKAVRDYWSTSLGLRNILISSTMSYARYIHLSAHIACCPRDENPDHWPDTTSKQRQHIFRYKMKHPCYPVQPLWDKVLSRCQGRFQAHREIAIDEAMIAYRGFQSACRKVFMPCKPIRAGFKVYALCDSRTGYMMNFLVHKARTQPQKMLDISMAVVQPFLKLYHHVFCDKLYTSVALGRQLLAKKTYLTGAIKQNARDLPVDLSPNPVKNPAKARSIKRLKKTPRGTFYSRQTGKLTYVLWHDSSVMSILSTAHNAWREKPTPDNPRGGDTLQRRFSIDGVERKRKHPVPAPPQVIDYTKHMGGVDRSNQLRAYHTCSRKSQSWWHQLIYFLIDVARVNAWVAYKFVNGEEAHPDRPKTWHSRFAMEIAEGLIAGYSESSMRKNKGQRHCREPHIRGQGVSPENAPGHILVRLESAPGKKSYGRDCRECALSGRKRQPPGPTAKCKKRKNITSRYGCAHCRVPLCRASQFNCFARYVSIHFFLIHLFFTTFSICHFKSAAKIITLLTFLLQLPQQREKNPLSDSPLRDSP